MNSTVAVGLVAAVVAIFGYTVTNAMNRMERRSRIYADAISALVQFQGLPLRIRRRSDSDGATRSAVGERVREVQEALSYHVVLLRLDSPRVGAAFAQLVHNTREVGRIYRQEAWASPPASDDADMGLYLRYDYHNQVELESCITLMQRELSMIRALSPQVFRFRAKSPSVSPEHVKDKDAN
jgi:hypothetical protein